MTEPFGALLALPRRRIRAGDKKRLGQTHGSLMNPPYYPDWTRANGDAVAQLTAITGDSGQLWPYPVSALPVSIAQGMPGLEKAFISGYLKPQNVPDGLNAIGELLVTRAHDVAESGKAYIYLVGIDQNDTPYFRGPYKPYPEHYYNVDSGVPLDRLFGRINISLPGRTNV